MDADTAERFDRLEVLLKGRPQANPLEAIGKLMESELVQGVQEKAEAFESYVKAALADTYKKLDRVEQKINLLSGKSL